MTKTDKIDDYYAKLPENEEKKSVKKPKIKAKKKIVIKKASPAKEVKTDEKKPSVKKVVKKVTKKSDTPKKTKVVQKISVVKKSEQTPVRKFTVKKADKNKVESPSESKIKLRGEKTPQKTFKNNAPKGGTQHKEAKHGDKANVKGFKGRNKTRGKVSFFGDDEPKVFSRSKSAKAKKQEKKVEDIKQNLVEKRGETITVGEFIQLKELSEKLGVVLPRLIAEFMKNGIMVNINSKIDFDSACIIAEAFDISLEKDNSAGASVEDIMLGDISSFLEEVDTAKLVPRAPVISIMGHVDHGKTSLLDHIRKSKVASGEAGGITQSIGAYQVELETGRITFLDTPGHEAFTVMRARGAKSTDIAILVVAADEGVKPQTIESINHAKEAGIPVIVAINKMDKEGANPDFVKGQLAENNLTPEDWGGDTPMIPVSAHTGFGIDDLLDMILLVAEMKELKANPDRNGVATVIESHLDHSLGPVATVLVNTGTVSKGDHIVCGPSFGKIKILRNYANQQVKYAAPGEPVLIVGLDNVVEGGDILQVVSEADTARQKSIEYKAILEKQKNASASGLDMLMAKIKTGKLKQLKIILKADTNGSLEAIKNALVKLSTEETTVTVIHSGVGAITESDILMGQGSQAILVGFSVGLLPNAKPVLESSGVEFINSEIIYHITEKIEKIVTGMLDPKEVETILGTAKVGGIFYTDKKFMILGLRLADDSTIEAGVKIRVFRKKKYIGGGDVESLKQGTVEVKQVEGPTECGIKFVGDTQVEEGDQLEFYKIEIQK